MKTTTFKVQQFNFNNGKFKMVTVPNDEISDSTESNILDMIWRYGQNDFSIGTKDSPSLSVGDVIFLNDKKYLVKPFGFKKLSDKVYNMLVNANETCDNSNHKTNYRNTLYKLMGDRSFEYC